MPDLETAARTLGQNIRVLDASTKSQINAAFKKLPELRADALIVISDAFLNEQTISRRCAGPERPHRNELTIHILAAVAQHEREIISART